MRRPSGFSLVELMVVVIAIAILAGALLDRVLPLIGRAQRTAFVQVKADLQTALLLEAAERITRGEAGSLQSLAESNPMRLLLVAPANYVGAFERPHEDEIPVASWYFDEHAHRLVYRVGNHTRFDALGGPPARIELKTEFVFDDRNGDGKFDPGADDFRGLRLAPVHAFSWPD
jgi:prepilin-type N-terminal cleavage/methylation domain-containing protein